MRPIRNVIVTPAGGLFEEGLDRGAAATAEKERGDFSVLVNRPAPVIELVEQRAPWASLNSVPPLLWCSKPFTGRFYHPDRDFDFSLNRCPFGLQLKDSNPLLPTRQLESENPNRHSGYLK